MEYRPVPEERTAALRRILGYAFGPEDPPDPEEEPPPPARMGEPRGLFADDRLVSVCNHLFFDAAVRNATLTVGGLTFVATPPEHRREGHVRRLVAESLAEYRERGVPLTALWPFSNPFYAAFGYETANRYTVHECDPDALAFARGAGAGEVVRLDADDWERADRAYRAHAAEYELTVERTEEWWRKRVFSGWEDDPYAYGVRVDGEVRGYVVYGVDSEGGGRTLSVQDMAHADHATRLRLLALLADHDSQVGRVRLYGPPDTSLLDLAEDPGDIEAEIDTGAMARLVDVPAGLEALSYPADVEAEVVLGVADPLADWNEGAFRLAVDDGAATVGTTDAAPEATLGIGALTQLALGYRSVGALETAGELSVEQPAARSSLAAAFPPRTPFLRERF